MSRPLQVAALLSALFVLYWALPGRIARRRVLLAASVGALAVYSPGYAAAMIILVLLAHAAARRLREATGTESGLTLARVALASIVSCLVLAKAHLVFQQAGPPVMTSINAQTVSVGLGFSYIVFRLIHYVAESYRKTIPAIGWESAMSYALFLPTLIAGPVERVGPFVPQENQGRFPKSSELTWALFRILSGVLKKFVLADSLRPILDPIVATPDSFSQVQVLAAIPLCTIRIYLDFSGYTDIAIGTAALFGYRIRENFRFPLLSANIADFWRRWHITLHETIRDYFFLPLFARRASVGALYLGLSCSMLVLMLWHSFTVNFFVLGILHSLALIAWQLFQDFKRRVPAARKLASSPGFRVASTFLTFSFTSLTFLLLYTDTAGALRVLSRLL